MRRGDGRIFDRDAGGPPFEPENWPLARQDADVVEREIGDDRAGTGAVMEPARRSVRGQCAVAQEDIDRAVGEHADLPRVEVAGIGDHRGAPALACHPACGG
ncbi:MAG: hypothetical protein WKF75_01640 [Singulisphaera sp.]